MEPSPQLNPTHIWRAVLGQLELQVSRPVFDTWLSGTRGTALDESVLLVEAPNSFVVESIEKRMYQTVLKSVQSVAAQILDVRFYVTAIEETPMSALETPVLTNVLPPPGLNSQYTFATLVVAPSNQLAVSAAQAICEAPGATYNPLFIYASPGLGKTHLMHAIAHAAHKKGHQVRYVTSEGFTNEFIQGIRSRTTEDFRTRYRSVDMLLVDDIQFLEGKDQTLEGFFHTVNDLHTSRKQLVLASELPPQRLGFLDDRLRSRLEGGLVTYLQVPDAATRLTILHRRCESIGMTADAEALESLATIDVGNIRELEGIFTRAVALATLKDGRITTETVSEAVLVSKQHPSTSSREPHRSSHEQVMSSIAQYYGITLADITGRKRSQKLIMARQAAMHIMSSGLQMGVTDISKALCRDHSTVSLALKRMDGALPGDPTLQADITSINGLLSKEAT